MESKKKKKKKKKKMKKDEILCISRMLEDTVSRKHAYIILTPLNPNFI